MNNIELYKEELPLILKNQRDYERGKMNLVISCFFLRLSNTLKQPALLHFITGVLQNLLRSNSQKEEEIMKKNTLLLLVLVVIPSLVILGFNSTVWAQLQKKPVLQKSQKKAVLGKAVKLPDLVVSRIELTKKCEIKVTIKNQGKGGVPSRAYDPLHGVIIQATAGNAGWGGYHLSMIDPAKKLKRPGASVSYVGFKRALKAGENLTLKVAILDPNNTAKESNTKNNSKTVRLVCKKPGLSEAKIIKPEAKVLEPRQIKPDLTVKMMKIEPANPTTEDTIKFSAFITNIGAADAPQSKAGIRIGGETNPMVWDKPVITPQSSNAIVRLKRLTVPQNYRVTFIADAMDDVSESDENNNEKYLAFKVTESPPLQVVYPTNSQHFQILNNKIKITVRFNKPVNKNSVITKSSFRINMETDHNASGTIQWVNDSELIWTSTKNYHDLCTFNPDCSFSLTITDTVTDTFGKKLDGDKDGNPGGNFTHVLTIIG